MSSRANPFSRRLARPVTEQTKAKGPLELPVNAPLKMTKRSADRFEQRMYIAHLPEALQTWWTAFIGQLRAGDKKALELGARVFHLDQKSGININVAANANSQSASMSKALPPGVNGLEYILRQFEERDRAAQLAPSGAVRKALPAPEIVLDAEPVSRAFSIEDLLPDA